MLTLYAIPDTVIILLCAVLFGGSILVISQIVQRVPWIKPERENTDFVIRIQGTLFALIGLLLAFTLVQTHNQHRRAMESVEREASVLNRTDRLLARYGTEKAAALRPYLLHYAELILQDEWPAMRQGKDSVATHAAWSPLAQGILALDPSSAREESLFSELLDSLNDIVEARDKRLFLVPLHLPYTYWFVILFAVLMLMFISSTLTSSVFRATNLFAQMAALGSIVGFVYLQDQPFSGDFSVMPDAMTRSIELMKARH